MEKERLVIKNFGPIKSVDLDLGKMTILIGDQATGKSTIAKVLAVCRYFSYIVNYHSFDEKISNQDSFQSNFQFYSGLSIWGLGDYIYPDSKIIYSNNLYKFEFICEFGLDLNDNAPWLLDQNNNPFIVKTKLETFNNFQHLLNELEELREYELGIETEENNDKYWTPNENFYRLNVKKIMDNPFYFPTERALQTNSFGRDLFISEAIIDELNKLNRIIRSAKKEWKIDHLSLSYKNIDGLGFVKKDNEKRFYPLHFGASGYQSSIPIVLAINYYNVLNRNRTFIVEEPELNLFPKTQKKLVEFFVESINNNGHSFLIPTHSPYVLSSLNNLLYAYKIGNLKNGKYKKEVLEIIDEQFWLNPKETSVYYLENGEAKNLLDTEDGLIEIDDLDSVSDIINKEFDELLSIDVEHNNTEEND